MKQEILDELKACFKELAQLQKQAPNLLKVLTKEQVALVKEVKAVIQNTNTEKGHLVNTKAINSVARLVELYDKLNTFSKSFSYLYTNRLNHNLTASQRQAAYLDFLIKNEFQIKDAFNISVTEFNNKQIQQSDIDEYLALFPEFEDEAQTSPYGKERNFADLNTKLRLMQNTLLPSYFEVNSIFEFCTEFGQSYVDFDGLSNTYTSQLNDLVHSLVFQPELPEIINTLENLRKKFAQACNTQNAEIQELFKDFLEKFGQDDYFDFHKERLLLAQERAQDNQDARYLSKIDSIEQNPEVLEKDINKKKYKEVILPLFNQGIDFSTFTMDENDISPNDVTQGALGDCSFLAALSSVVQSNADLVRNMIVANSNGSYTVTFHIMQPDGQRTPTEITVTNEILLDQDGKPAYAGLGDDELWVIVLEKAYAKVMGGYDNIGVGVSASEAIAALTNREVSKIKLSEAAADLINTLQEALQNNQIITIGSKDHDDPSIIEPPNLQPRFGDPNNGFEIILENNLIIFDHQYSLISINGNVLNLRNPHGRNHIKDISIDNLKAYFSYIYIA